MKKLIPTVGGQTPWPNEIWDKVIHLLQDGVPLPTIARMEGMPSYAAIYDRVKSKLQFERARNEGLSKHTTPKVGTTFRPDIWDGVIYLFTQGLTPSQIGKMPGMPAATTIRARVRDVPEFAEAVSPFYRQKAEITPEERKQARRDRHNAYRRDYRTRIRTGEHKVARNGAAWDFDDLVAARIIKAVGDGLSIERIGKMPGMPPAHAIRDRRRYDLEFAQRLQRAHPDAVRDYFPLTKPQRTWSDITWDRVADYLNAGWSMQKISAIPGMPPAYTISRHRRRDADFSDRVPHPKKSRSGRVLTKTWDDILLLLGQGMYPEQIADIPGMPAGQSIRDKIARDPEYAALAKRVWPTQAKQSREEKLARKRAYNAARRATMVLAEKPAVQPRINMSPEEIYALARKAVSRRISEDVRDDIIAAIVVAVYEGSLKPQDIQKQAPEFVRAYNSEFGDFRTASLDATVGGKSSRLGGIAGVY